jgi:hypothetical protein
MYFLFIYLFIYLFNVFVCILGFDSSTGACVESKICSQQQCAFETSEDPEHCGETYHPQKKVRAYYTRANGFTLASD